MSRDYLGLFDTPANRNQVRAGVVIVGLLVVFLAVILPVRDIPLGEVGAFVPAIDAVTRHGAGRELLPAAAAKCSRRALIMAGT